MRNKKLLRCLFFMLVLTSCDFQFEIELSSSEEVVSEIESVASEEIFSSEEISSESSIYSSSSEKIVSSYSSAASSYYSSVSGFTVKEDGRYTDVESVAMYITTFHKLPSNYIRKNQKDNYDNTYSIGGDYFGNYEGYLPSSYNGSYKECDIDATKNKRGAKRIVYETKTYRIFYTTDHYENFKEYYGYKNWSKLFGESNDIY